MLYRCNWYRAVFVFVEISDAVKSSYGRDDDVTEYISMQTALYMTCFVCAIGGGFFLLTALFIEQDRQRTDKITQGQSFTLWLKIMYHSAYDSKC